MGRTESVERRADEHKDVALGAAECGPVLVRDLIRGNEHAKATNANEDALRTKVMDRLEGGRGEGRDEVKDRRTRSCVQWYFGRMYSQEKSRQTGMAHASSSMQESRVVYWYALTTRKLPSTSHAARMKSNSDMAGSKLLIYSLR